MDTWVTSTFRLLWIRCDESLLKLLLSVYPEVELLAHVVVVRLILDGCAIRLSTSAAPFYFPAHVAL